MLNITNNPAFNFHPVFIPLNPIFRSIKTKVFRISPAISLLIFGLILVSCAGLSKPLEPPRVSLADIRVEKFTGFETVFRIQLRVINTNDTNLNVKGLEAQLEIN
ncbi:MAG: hypothetical protein PVI42_12980, partial [Desulfobacterales bacterium]